MSTIKFEGYSSQIKDGLWAEVSENATNLDTHRVTLYATPIGEEHPEVIINKYAIPNEQPKEDGVLKIEEIVSTKDGGLYVRCEDRSMWERRYGNWIELPPIKREVKN